VKKYLYFLRITPQGQRLPVVEKIIYAESDTEADERVKQHIPEDFTGEVYFVRVMRNLMIGFCTFPAVLDAEKLQEISRNE